MSKVLGKKHRLLELLSDFPEQSKLLIILLSGLFSHMRIGTLEELSI